MTKRKDQNSGERATEVTSNQPGASKVNQLHMTNFTENSLDTPAVDARVQGIIGRQLRAHYDGLVGDKVPDKLLKLLDNLAKSEQSPKKDE
jgi:Anti-sigma factor NepR